jgi:hypothetical protein
MKTLTERVLELLDSEGRPRTNKQIATALKLKPRDMTGLAAALTDLSRAKRARYVNGEGWTTEDCTGPVEAAVANGKTVATAARLEAKANGNEAPSDASSEGAAMPKPKKGGPDFGASTLSLLRLLGTGPKTRAQIIEALPDQEEAIDNRLWTLKGSGHIVRVKRGMYALPSNTVADELDVRVAEQPKTRAEIADSVRKLADKVAPNLRDELVKTIHLVQDGKLGADAAHAIVQLVREARA